jgi:S1-C subfamily serine protease
MFCATAGAWFALAGSCLPVRAELKPEDLYAAVVPSIVTLDVENADGRHFVGTAFLAVGDGLAVTAWHVVHDAQHVEGRYAGGDRVRVAGLVDKNEQLDLALIKLEGPARPRITLGAAAPRIGSRIYVLGSPRGFDFSISEGLISQVRTLDGVRYYQLSCPISPGDSGGPVLNDRGEAIGLRCALCCVRRDGCCAGSSRVVVRHRRRCLLLRPLQTGG